MSRLTVVISPRYGPLLDPVFLLTATYTPSVGMALNREARWLKERLGACTELVCKDSAMATEATNSKIVASCWINPQMHPSSHL